MMGIKARLFAPVEHLTLDALVPADHFYRYVERTLDLAFVRDLVADCYAPDGRPSIDPVVFFKLQLVMFFEGIRSERRLVIAAADRLSLRWYLGYDLDEPLPNHSSLTRIRDRYGLERFRRFFAVITEQCCRAGLVWGRELYIDSTKVAANAALDSLQPRFAVEAHLAHLFADSDNDDQADLAEDTSLERVDATAPMSLPLSLTEAERSAVAELNRQRHDWIADIGRPDRAVTSGLYRRTADFRVSVTDPDATPLPLGEGRTHLGYHDHYVVDGGKARIILTALVTPAEVQDNQPASTSCGRPDFAGSSTPTGSPATPSTAPSPTSRRSKARASTHTCHCRRSANGPACSGKRTSPMTRRPIPTAAQASRRCGCSRRMPPRGAASTRPHGESVPHVRCGTNARRRPAAGGWGGASTRTPSTGCAATMGRSPTRRRCASARSG